MYSARAQAIVLSISLIILLALNLAYTTYAINLNNKKWCALVTKLDMEYEKNPPQTEVGRGVAYQINELVSQFHC